MNWPFAATFVGTAWAFAYAAASMVRSMCQADERALGVETEQVAQAGHRLKIGRNEGP